MKLLYAKNNALVKKLARSSVTLLRNVDAAMPLPFNSSVLVIAPAIRRGNHFGGADEFNPLSAVLEAMGYVVQ
jgi:hypothetical protein